MNRKRTAKKERGIAADLAAEHPFDNIDNWLKADYQTPPWPKEKIADFQKQLDSAFGAENAIVLVWSGDRRYGDVFLDEDGNLERKPVLLFAEKTVGPNQQLYISCPRWLLMEVYHGSQLEASWKSSSVVTDQYGVERRIRPEKPPKYFYSHLRVIATHEEGITRGGIPPCCERLWVNGKRVCYGKYRLPDASDIAFVGEIRRNMDRAGVAQRNDAERGRKVLEQGALAAQHHVKQAQYRHAQNTKELMLANPRLFFQSILDQKGSTMSAPERDRIVAEALESQDEERFDGIL